MIVIIVNRMFCDFLIAHKNAEAKILLLKCYTQPTSTLLLNTSELSGAKKREALKESP